MAQNGPRGDVPYRPGAAPSSPDSSSSCYCWPARAPCRPSPGLSSRRTASNWLTAGSSRQPPNWAPTVRRCRVPTTRRRAGTPSGACLPPSSRRCRTTAPIPTSTTARTCSTRCRTISTNRTGGTARRSRRPPVTPPTCSSCPASTTAPRSGSTATWSRTTHRSSACTTRTNSTSRAGSFPAYRTPLPSRSRRSGHCRTSTGSSSPTVGGTGSTGNISGIRVRVRTPTAATHLSPTGMRASGSRCP